MMNTFFKMSRKSKRSIVLIFALFALSLLNRNDSSENPSRKRSGRGLSGSSKDKEKVDAADAVEKPIMHTFFEPNGPCCGMTEAGHANLVEAWEFSWQSRGWDTKILTKEDALKNPEFDMYDKKLADLNVSEYNRRCFWRWLAMASISNDSEGGGWMSDYDTFPLGLTAEEGLEIAKQPGFKSYSLHVPNIIHATAAAWDRVMHAMLRVMPEEYEKRQPGDPQVTDMLMLLDAKNQFDNESMMITEWKSESRGFMYNETTLEILCDAARLAKVAHLSHADCETAYELHTYPQFDGLNSTNFIEKRGEAALKYMNDYREQCLEKEL